MTSKERLMAAINLEQPDRVPVKIWGVGPETKARHPSFQPIIDAAIEKTDLVASWGMGGGIFMSATEEVETTVEECPSRIDEFEERVTIHVTPRGPLTTVHVFNREGKPGYTMEYLIETEEDAEKFLSIPYVPIEGDLSSYFEKEKELGDRGIIIVGMGSDPMYQINSLMGSATFALWSVEKRSLLLTLIETMFQRCRDYVEYQLKGGVGPVFGYVGPELCIPPLQSPADFDEFVVQFDSQLNGLVHDYGGKVWVHSHGRMDAVLEKFVELGCDCLNPIEPPPMGDVTLAEAKRRVGDRLCLEGNIEKGDLYRAEPGVIRAQVRQAIEQAAPGGGLILCPTAGIQEWPVCSDRTRDNFLDFIEAGLEYGGYPPA